MGYLFVLGAVCGLTGFRLGWRSGHRWLLPILEGGMGFLAFYYAWAFRGPLPAVAAVAGWAVGVTLVAVPTFRRHPLLADDRVLRAAPYRSSMLAWLRTGEGPESRPLATAWAHARELAVYVVVALLTANAASLVLGAVLLNYMNAWVARLVAAARRPVRVALLAWNVWSVVRVAGYVFLGAACAAPLLARLGHPADPAIARRLALAGVLAVALDLGLKLALSKPCGRLLADAVDLDAV